MSHNLFENLRNQPKNGHTFSIEFDKPGTQTRTYASIV